MLWFRLAVVVLVSFILWFQYKLWLGEAGFDEVSRLERAIAVQQQENIRLRERNDALEADVRDLKDGLKAMEERARTELGMIRPGETFYQVVEP